MIKRIIFATGNPGKVKEIDEILKDLGLEVVTMKEAGFDPEIVECLEEIQDLVAAIYDCYQDDNEKEVAEDEASRYLV